jgi:pyrroline-5-carboxylate reductase
MPNINCLINESASVYSTTTEDNKPDETTVTKIFSSVGTIIKVDEKLMDSVTGIKKK